VEITKDGDTQPSKGFTPLEAVLIGLDQFKDTINTGVIPRAKKGGCHEGH
jgi:hypothetical protein